MHISEFDYELPAELIAQSPAEQRDGSRLLCLDRKTGSITHGRFRDLPGLLAPGDVLVINDTKVYPARLAGFKRPNGGSVEALILRELGGGRFEALTRGRLPEGSEVVFGGRLAARVSEDLGGGMKVLDFGDRQGIAPELDALGRMPLPPYIDQGARSEDEDRDRYQTVYAKKRGAVAAPTAGLHFTGALLDEVRGRGVEVVAVTLHVGPGTFMPVREETVERHVMHSEDYEISPQAAGTVNAALSTGRRVVAVGTTSTRALESAAGGDGRVAPGASSSELFIYPGYSFRVTGAMVTNFHLPRSTLLMLLCAFAGREKVMAAYKEAVRLGYRFYSYGDAMFVY